MEGVGIFSGILGIILIVLAILALLMPFFVFQIRDQTKAINKKLSILIDILQKEDAPLGDAPEGETHSPTTTQSLPQPTALQKKRGNIIVFVIVGAALLYLIGSWLIDVISAHFG